MSGRISRSFIKGHIPAEEKKTWRNDFSSLTNVSWQKKIFVAHFTLAFTLRIGYTYRKVRKNAEFLAKAMLTKVAAQADQRISNTSTLENAGQIKDEQHLECYFKILGDYDHLGEI